MGVIYIGGKCLLGPRKINGVALRRVNQAFVIATSTKVDVSKVDTSSVDDAFFRSYEKAAQGSSAEFLAGQVN